MPNVYTPEFRVNWPKVFKPELNKLNGKMEYSIVALFPKAADFSKMKQAAKEACEEKWGKDAKKWPANLRNPFRDQGEKLKVDAETGKEVLPAGYETGCVFMQLKSANKPQVVNQQVEEIMDQSEFYSGCWARATVSVYAYSQAGNNGVNFGLQNIQKVRDGEPLSGRTKAQDDFAPIEGLAGVGSATSLFN